MRRISLLFLLSLLFALAMPAVSASAAKTPPTAGTVYGFVDDDITGAPVTAASVTAYSWDKRAGWKSVSTAVTDSLGRYNLSLAPGSYAIGISAQDYDAEFHRDAASLDTATLTPVESGATVAIDASLRPRQDGTAAYPYLVYDLETLAAVSANPAAHFAQIADIDASATSRPGDPWNRGGAGWSPLCAATPFTGTYDGRGHSISGLYCNDSTSSVGLFRYIKWGTVRNLRLVDLTMIGAGYAGGVCAATESGGGQYLYDVDVQGRIEGDSFVGGLIGLAWSGGIVVDCDVDAVIGDSAWGNNSAAGGLFGFVYYPNIERCSTAGSVSCDGAAGGIVGSAHTGSIRNSFSTMRLVSEGPIGGITSHLWTSAGSHSVSNCYYAGEAAPLASAVVGGIVGDTTNSAAVVNSSYFNIETAPMGDNGLGTPATTTQLQETATFSGWDFVSIWNEPVSVTSYPTLR